MTDVRLRVQSEGIELLATVTDPQGSDDIRGILQTVGVFESSYCNAISFDLLAKFRDSGREKSFGIVVDAAVNPVLYAEIAAASAWPAHVDIVDEDGNRTSGRVAARVVH